MSFKTVFLAVGAAQDDAEIDRAVTICEALCAHLAVLVVGIAPPPPASPYGVVSNDIWAGDIREGQAEVEGRARAVEAKLAGTTLSSLVAAQYIDRGTVATLAARFARYADLTLVTPHCEASRRCSPGSSTARCSSRAGRSCCCRGGR